MLVPIARTRHHFAAAEGRLEVRRVVHGATAVDGRRCGVTGCGRVAHDVVGERPAIVAALVRDGDAEHRRPTGINPVGSGNMFGGVCLGWQWKHVWGRIFGLAVQLLSHLSRPKIAFGSALPRPKE